MLHTWTQTNQEAVVVEGRVHSVQCTTFSIQFVLYSIQCAVYSEKYTVNSIQ